MTQRTKDVLLEAAVTLVAVGLAIMVFVLIAG